MNVVNKNLITICYIIFCFTAGLYGQGRFAVVHYSDGSIREGILSLPKGRQLKFNIPDGGDIFTSDMVTGEPVKYGKVRKIDLSVIDKLTFMPKSEELLQKWKFTSQTKYDEETAIADYSPAEKEYYGKYYPVRYLIASARLNSGEVINGNLYTISCYMKSDDAVRKIVLNSKQRGNPGQTLDELVYVSCIRFLDSGKSFVKDEEIEILNFDLDSENDKAYAVTVDSLTPVSASISNSNNSIVVNSAFGENVYLAVKRNDKYMAGWPKSSEPNMFNIAKNAVDNLKDFYNEKKLLGIVQGKDETELLTLVSLRRRYADTNFGEIGGEWDKESGEIVEPWRLSIWRWRVDKSNDNMVLVGRGTLDRRILKTNEQTPEVEIVESLWNIQNK